MRCYDGYVCGYCAGREGDGYGSGVEVEGGGGEGEIDGMDEDWVGFSSFFVFHSFPLLFLFPFLSFSFPFLFLLFNLFVSLYKSENLSKISSKSDEIS